MLCSGERNPPAVEGERKAPAVVVVIEGGSETLEAASKAIEADVPLMVFEGSGRAADFIAAAYDRRFQPLVVFLPREHMRGRSWES